MLASRLARIAADILQEYSRFEVIQLLTDAVNFAANRPNLAPAQYRERLVILKQRAQTIVEQTVFRTYPIELLTVISQSEVSPFLPASLAKVIVAGLSEKREEGISSAELQIYLNLAKEALHELNGHIAFANRLGVRPYDIPADRIGIDIKIPRTAFENEIGSLGDKLRSFDKFLKSISELATSSRQKIDLLYISTTDPVFCCVLLPAAAWGVLQFYKLLLEVAEKQINVWKAIRDLRDSGIAKDKIDSMTTDMKELIARETSKAIEEAFARTKPKVDEGRKNEIKNEINMQAPEIVANIASGARIYISLESQNQIELLVKSVPVDESEGDVRAQIESQKSLEAKLDGIMLREKPRALIGDENSDN